MILITCPNCGPRNETEFHYGGQAHVAQPADPYALSDEEWGRFLFYRDNPKGLFAERWSHAVGCRKWFNVVRDTVSYRIAAVYRVGEPRPVLDGPSPGTAPGEPAPGRPAPGRPAHEREAS